MRNKKLLSLILIAMLIVCMVPASAFAATKNATVEIDKKSGEPEDDWDTGWEVGYDSYEDDKYEDEGIIIEEGYTATFKGGTCKVPVFNYGTISSGTFSGVVVNMEGATIKGGTFSGTVENNGTISAGTFNEAKNTKILNNKKGTISGGTFKNAVTNYGTVKGGKLAEITNEEGGIVSGGTFSKKSTNYGEIKKGATFNGGIQNLGKISGGTFYEDIINGDKSDTDYEEAVIKGGTFGEEDGDNDDYEVYNYAVLDGGTYYLPVNNFNTIEDGSFYEKVTLDDNKYYDLDVSGGTFSLIENDSDDYEIEEDELSYFITTAVTGKGNISVNKSAKAGSKVTVLTAPVSGSVKSIKVTDSEGDKVKITESKANNYSFTMPESAVKIAVTYDGTSSSDDDDDDDDNGVTGTGTQFDKNSEISTIRLYIANLVIDDDLPNPSNVINNKSIVPNYKLTRAQWVDEDGDDYDEEVEEDTEYTLEMTVEPTNGCKFAAQKNLTVTLNGEKCKIEKYYDDELRISYTFKGFDEGDHQHTYSGKYTSAYHWRECKCGNIVEKEEHVFGKDGKCLICSYYDEAKDTTIKKTAPFTDVKSSDYYYDAVVWAYNAKPQVTDGTTKTTFSPSNTCNRGQVVTFLWRTAGEPAPKSTNNPFYDVKSSDFFYKPVLWAVEKGITEGITEKDGRVRFDPNGDCTNAHVLTFIWRAMGSPEKDANAADWWTDAYYWAKYNGLLKGSYTGTYPINGKCTRANAVYYLYKYSTMNSSK